MNKNSTFKCKTTKQFILDAKLVHGEKYDYSQTTYQGIRKKIKILCKIHGEFEQTPNAHLSSHGCPKCVGKYRPTTKEFIIQAKQTHGDLYNYSLTNYISTHSKVSIICNIHGIFKQSPHSHLIGKSGCPECAGNILLTTEKFITQARQVHGNKYNYSKVKYSGTHRNITITCKIHGDFFQTPNNHVGKQSDYPKCINTQHSQVAIDWLNYVSLTQKISIQHAENVGEFRIPNTRWKVDGYCRETNTIYEFHGDAYHGNPNRYQPTDKYHPFLNLTAAELYSSTILRENQIKKLGYNLVVMWQQDWKQNQILNQL